MEKLLKLEGAITNRKNVHADVLQTHSPSVNFAFGNGWGLPRGFSLLMYGPPKAGKTLISNSFVGQMHQNDPTAIAIKFDTEYREVAQLSQKQAAVYGIDMDRIITYQTNKPDEIFDRIERDIAAMCQEGLNVGLIIIDSINGIQGRRAMNADSIMVQQIGDTAATIQEGLRRILPVQRKYNIGVILTAQIRAQMDQAAQRRGEMTKPAVAFATQHHCEYFMSVEPNRSKDGRTTLLGSKLEDAELTDFMDNAERIGHKIRAKMSDSSLGPKGRTAEFTLDYDHGVVNSWEEAFTLGVGRGVISKPTSMSYEFDGRKWVGGKTLMEALINEPELVEKVLNEVKARDQAGKFKDKPEDSEESS